MWWQRLSSSVNAGDIPFWSDFVNDHWVPWEIKAKKAILLDKYEYLFSAETAESDQNQNLFKF